MTETRKKIVLIGGGIMSATLGVLLKKLLPTAQIDIFERLDRVAAESSEAMNNAGTGHSAFCELNYTPENEQGLVDITKAVKIASAFEVSKEFWAWLLREGDIRQPEAFIRHVPHISFVWGADNVGFLRKRYEAMRLHPLFEDMEFSEDSEVLQQWMPLVMNGRDPAETVAATRMQIGTDVDFGTLTHKLFEYLTTQNNVALHLQSEVRDLCRQDDGTWRVEVRDIVSDTDQEYSADFVFIGAGGGALPLLEKSNIEEAEGYGGFPISGQWLVCNNPEVIERHHAKVYGKAAIGAPPMSVPHLDTRVIDGKKALLFGPFAGFSTKFLKNGSYWDLPASIELENILPMLAAGWHNLALTQYLIQQVAQSPEDRFDALRAYFPEARIEDWRLEIAGQRVQVIKKDDEKVGVLEFGTELVCASDGSLAALLGASPGASTSVVAMLDVLKKCFAAEMKTPEWKTMLKKMAPSYGAPITKANRCHHSREVRQRELFF
ncbi:MAG: malate dehydrogenase (quinone) [Saprospiraceae bacterium]|nr:malate dehydrogenase (quinone) [Saprospiraceae bacterium]